MGALKPRRLVRRRVKCFRTHVKQLLENAIERVEMESQLNKAIIRQSSVRFLLYMYLLLLENPGRNDVCILGKNRELADPELQNELFSMVFTDHNNIDLALIVINKAIEEVDSAKRIQKL